MALLKSNPSLQMDQQLSPPPMPLARSLPTQRVQMALLQTLPLSLMAPPLLIQPVLMDPRPTPRALPLTLALLT
jgi:hypothetical protein